MIFESENIEFKSQFTKKFYKEVIAFANTDGGIAYVGIDSDGKVVGLTDVDKEYTRITNGIRNVIMPDVTMFVRFVLQENKVVSITISEGTYKPYYLKKKELKPSGDTFEEVSSLKQELTFEAAKRAFNLNGVEFSPEKYRTLGITQGQDGLYTNLALLLSDQCKHTTKIAVFSDNARTVFRDSKEFSGSIFKQFEESINYLTLCNKTSAVIKGIVRTEKKDYPEEAIREALLNAIVHRDYSYSGSIIINVTDKKMVFISLGGLLPGLSPDDIRSGISQPRNKYLAEVFYRLRLKSYGAGIRRIYNLYAECQEQPKIEVTTNTFKIVLPNMNAISAATENGQTITPQMEQVLDYIKANGQITEKEMSNLLGLKKTRTYTVAQKMRVLGLIKVVGRGENKKYLLQ